MTDMIKFEPKEENRRNFIKVVGIGGGGSNAVNHMFSEGIQGVDFILCNTDYQALERSSVATKVHLGKRSLGAGNIPAEGRSAAMETVDELREIFSDDTKMIFITAGMGGGTGTGAAPVVASVARELDILTVGIVTMPFSFEGKRRRQQALDGIAELRKYVDALLVISNDKLRTEYGNMKLSEAFKKADDVLKTAAKGIAEIITVPGYVNVDFKDVNTVMRSSGKAIMGSGYAEGEGRALAAAEMAVHSPLLDDSDIKGAKNILVYIASGSEEVSLDEVTEIVEYIQDETGRCSDVIWGNGEDLSIGTGISVTLIATGFDYDEYNMQESDSHVKIHDLYKSLTESKTNVETRATVTVEPEIKKPEDSEIKVISASEAKSTIEPEIKVVPAAEIKTAEPEIKVVPAAEIKTAEPEIKVVPAAEIKTAEPEIKVVPAAEIKTAEPEIKVVPAAEPVVEKKQEPTPAVVVNKPEEKKVVHLLDENKKEDEEDDPMERNSNDNQSNVNDTSVDRGTTTESTITHVTKHKNPFTADDDEEDFGIKSYVTDCADTETKTIVKPKVQTGQNNVMSQQERLRRDRLASLTMNYKSMSNIEQFENQPAYMRRGINISMDSQEQELSNLSFNKNSGISENNTFLHDNVD